MQVALVPLDPIVVIVFVAVPLVGGVALELLAAINPDRFRGFALLGLRVLSAIAFVFAVVVAVRVGVVDSNRNGDLSTNALRDLASAHPHHSATYDTAASAAASTFASAQATQGLVFVTVGVAIATILGVLGRGGSGMSVLESLRDWAKRRKDDRTPPVVVYGEADGTVRVLGNLDADDDEDDPAPVETAPDDAADLGTEPTDPGSTDRRT